MRKTGIMLFLVSVVLLTLSLCARAGNRAGALSFTLGGGYDYFSGKRHIDNTSFPFLALGYQFTHHLGIEGVIGGFITRSHRLEDDDRQVRGTFAALDGIYHIAPDSTIEPFMLAGIGVNSFNPNGSDANNEGNVNAGAGVQVFVDKSLAFRVEARDVYTTVGRKNDILLDGGMTLLLDWC